MVFFSKTTIMKTSIFIIIIGLFLSCHTSKPNSMNKDCFSIKNFDKAKQYISYRKLVSSSGIFFLEFPADSLQINDGIKRPSNHPENIYKIDVENEIITIKSKTNLFKIDQTTGLEISDELNSDEIKLANQIFCFLVNSK